MDAVAFSRTGRIATPPPILERLLTDQAAGDLAELGFTATENGLSEGLEAIFDLLILRYPTNASGHVGRAYIAYNRDDRIGALAELGPEALSADENAEMAWAVRLFLLRLRDGPSVNAYLYPEIEEAVGPAMLAEIIDMADELIGAVDAGETLSVEYYGLPRWIWRRS